MDNEEMKRRTKQFALRVVRLVEALPRGRTADVLGRQWRLSGIFNTAKKHKLLRIWISIRNPQYEIRNRVLPCP